MGAINSGIQAQGIASKLSVKGNLAIGATYTLPITDRQAYNVLVYTPSAASTVEIGGPSNGDFLIVVNLHATNTITIQSNAVTVGAAIAGNGRGIFVSANGAWYRVV